MSRLFNRWFVYLFVSILVAGLGNTSYAGPSTPPSLSSIWTTLQSIPAGVAGGKEVVFVGAPLESRVMALSRARGTQIGDLPQPPGGFIVPFIIKSIGPNRIAVLDAGGLPSPMPFIPANPTIYEYDYALTGPTGRFTARLSRTIRFNSVQIGFAEDFVRLNDGSYVVSDAVIGAIWIGNTFGLTGASYVRPGIVPRSEDPADQIPQLAARFNMPVVNVGGIPFLFNGAAFPGVGAMALRNNILYFSTCAQGAVYSIPLSSLFDSRKPWERAADIRTVTVKSPQVKVEELLALTFNPFDATDPYLYAADALQLRIVRINVFTGQREVFADNRQSLMTNSGTQLFNFPSSMSFVDPIAGQDRNTAPLLVVSNQQHRSTITNEAITVDVIQVPFIVTKVVKATNLFVPLAQ